MSENIGQPTPIQRVQNQIDELTRERDLYKRMLERYEPDPTYSTPTELDRLRSRVAELEDAGDRVVEMVEKFVHPEDYEKVHDAAREWRTVSITRKAADE